MPLPYLPPRPVVIFDDDPLWPDAYVQARDTIHKAIGRWVAQIEHIGSTSVPGLGAKPIIDIMIGVRTLANAAHCIPVLEALGYPYVPEYEQYIPERRYFHIMETQTSPGYHLHMVETTSVFWQDHLLFRDYLRAHSEAARAYEDLRREMADQSGTDREGYSEAKTEFIQASVEKARQEFKASAL